MNDSPGRTISPDAPAQSASTDGDVALLNSQLRAVLALVIERRAAGGTVDDAALIAAYPHLMPRLAAELAALAQMHRAARAAVSAAATEDEPGVQALSLEELERPIEIEDDEGEAPLEGVDAVARHDLLSQESQSDHEQILALNIPGYQLLGELSVGGQATVFKAIHKAGGELVAVKVLIGGPFVNRAGRARFEREARSLAALDHPNIARLVGRGRTPDGSFYLATRFIDGACLDDWASGSLGGRPATLDEVLDVFVKIADAVQLAHDRGIIHRDLKPPNILVDRAGEPHVLDFGLARSLRDPSAAHAVDRPDHTVTITGNVLGSLRWSSPEQASGGSRDVGRASDVYSLGVILYELLAGAPPYPTEGSIIETIENIRDTIPRPLSGLSGCPFGPVAPELQRIVFKALDKVPARRYDIAGHLADDIRRFRGGEPIYARHLRTQRKLAWKRLVIAAMVVLVVAGIAIYQQFRKPPVVVVNLPRNTNSIGMEMVLVPTGVFQLANTGGGEGNSVAGPPKAVRVDQRFWIGTTEVTVGQYAAVMGRGAVKADQADDMPMANISWLEAMEFCRRLSAKEGRTYRLPTEVEWEYACRAGSNRPIAGSGNLDEMGWYSENSGGTAHQVARKSPNHWGLYDMQGNLAEWCLGGGYKAPKPPMTIGGLDEAAALVSDPKNRMARFRGGGIRSTDRACRVEGRDTFVAYQRVPDIGFRVLFEE